MIFTREKKEIWGFWNKVSFRFLFTYFTLYCCSIFSGSLWSPFVYWIGKNILNIGHEFSHKGYGSGDTTYAYIQVLLFFLIALSVTLVTSVIDRKRQSYDTLMWVFTILLRLILVFFLLVYGFSKVFYLQFSPPSLTRLLQPLGEMSPMGLAWTFMGYSKAYTIFSGLVEVFAGYLLISKRTQTIGAMLTIAVMGNVFMMNLCYDIPVKLFSIHLLLMGLILLLTDFNRLFGLFFTNETIDKVTYFSPYMHDKDIIKVVRGFKLLFIVGISGLYGFKDYTSMKKHGENREKPILYGIWEARHFIKNNDTIPPLITDHDRWRYLIIDRKDRAIIKAMDGKKSYHTFKPDSISRQIVFNESKLETDTPNFTYDNSSRDYLELKGILNSDTLSIVLYRKDDNFLLKTRGFNWINEQPFNR